MSSFGGKRQARKITVCDDDDEADNGAPVVRPTLGSRSSSSKLKKPGSRLSFGPSERTSIDDPLGDELPTFTPTKKSSSLMAAATEKSAYKKGITKNKRIPPRSMEADEDQPIYSKEYLSELQNSTPNTPANLGSHVADEDEILLDDSELEGATIFERTSTALSTKPPSSTTILTETEIAEKKARRERERARSAAQQQSGAEDFIFLDSGDERGDGESYLSALSRSLPSQISNTKERRFATDDELADDDSFFVEDGGLSLGKKAEREAARKKRVDMASMIAAAEGNSDGETSDDSEAERRVAYERTQTKAGMDGLAEEREAQRRRLGLPKNAVVPLRITPLSDLSVLVKEFKARMSQKETAIRRMRDKIDELRREREGIEQREPEVQQLLNEAGSRYLEFRGGVTRRADTPGGGRGLESLGTTPVGLERIE